VLSLLHKVLEEKVFLTREEALEYLKIVKAHSEGFRFWSAKLGRGFRSSWEVELAELMTELGIRWEYEPKRFHFWRERESYLPDFYLPDYNVWIEVKGYMDRKSARRIRLFKKYYGKEYGFLLYEAVERELVKKNPSVLLVLLEVAQKEHERRKRKR